MQRYNKIYIIGDFYRQKDGFIEQISNTNVLFYLISQAIQNVTGVTPEIPYSVVPHNIPFSIWLEALESKGISFLTHIDLSNSFVVGFEIAPLDKAYLKKNNVPFISLEIHPIRFSQDLYWSLEFNDETRVLNSLKKFEIPEAELYQQAHWLKALILGKQNKLPEYTEDSSILLIGQTASDRSIFENGKMLNFLDYKDELQNLLQKKQKKILFKPHPYNNSMQEVNLKNSFPTLEIVTENVYNLLCKTEISEIITISSSVGYEAQYFNKKNTFLKKKRLFFSNPIHKNCLVSEDFWIEIFGLITTQHLQQNQKNTPEIPFSLRELFYSWAYPIPHNLDLTSQQNSIKTQLEQESKSNKDLNVNFKDQNLLINQQIRSLDQLINSNVHNINETIENNIRAFHEIIESNIRTIHEAIQSNVSEIHKVIQSNVSEIHEVIQSNIRANILAIQTDSTKNFLNIHQVINSNVRDLHQVIDANIRALQKENSNNFLNIQNTQLEITNNQLIFKENTVTNQSAMSTDIQIIQEKNKLNEMKIADIITKDDQLSKNIKTLNYEIQSIDSKTTNITNQFKLIDNQISNLKEFSEYDFKILIKLIRLLKKIRQNKIISLILRITS